MVNVDHVSLFVASVECGSFSGAARAKGKSLSTVSFAISSLEDKLGLSLFDRKSKYPTLTKEGEALYRVSRNLLSQSERLVSLANGLLNEVEDTLTIGIDDVVPFEVIESGIIKLQNKYPNVRINIIRHSVSELKQLHKEGRIQLLIVLSEGTSDDGCEFIHFANFDVVAICSPESPLSETPHIDAEYLASQRQICCDTMKSNPGFQQYIVGTDTWEVSDFEDLIRLVELDLGWAAVPKPIAERYISLGTVTRFDTTKLTRASDILAVELRYNVTASQGVALRYLIEQLSAG
ncbi:LysR family transcriptional regulator [Vibrio barjaei]|uniref:LysR family transcriptional regulator n=1 Tax=Vibrio barjaei TaxID=1676683 RepID=UPI002284649A|nr:LysR family transcriptional regulator [Vibrio barjaei]MCY9871155.1 LysR family transcriptional regulator [Vibrio barjaei]